MSHKVYQDKEVEDDVPNACVYEVWEDSGDLNIKLSRSITSSMRDLSVDEIFDGDALYFLEAVVEGRAYSISITDEDMRCLVRGYLDIHNQYMLEGEAEVPDES